MDSLSRRYYEHQLGAGMGPEMSFEKMYGYTEPVRRLIQSEDFAPQANEIANTMPSWLPGDDYLINFRKGDPFAKIDQGYARLPGSGYEAIHPELKNTRVLRPWPQQKLRAPARKAVTPTLAIRSEQSPAFLWRLFSLSLTRRHVFALSFRPAWLPVYIRFLAPGFAVTASSCSPAHAHSSM